MTTITKIFVILVCLFAFIFTPMAIQFAARTYDWRALAEEQMDVAETAEANARSARAIAASEAEHYRDLLRTERDRIRKRDQQISELERHNYELTQQRDELKRSTDNLETSVRLLTAEMAVKSRHNEELAKTKENALGRERELQVKHIKLTDRVKELSAQVVELTKQLYQKLQEIEAFRGENEQLRKDLHLGKATEIITATPTPSVKPASPVVESPIHGTVTEVRSQLARLDVGSAAGLKQGMIMVVLRNNDYICDLRVTSDITPNEAVAEIELAGGKQVRVNDQIMDLESFNSRY